MQMQPMRSSLLFSLASLASLAILSCSPTFEPQSKIQSLRVLAVQKDKPFARPGETVTLRMLLADGSKEAPRPVQVLWLSGCENPLADLYAGCVASVTGSGGAAGKPEMGAPAPVAGSGLEFSFQLSPTIISRRPPPADRRQPPYGLSYVFFAACAGEVRVLPSAEAEGFPIGCFSKSGERLGPEDFVAGYTAVFAYESVKNTNPIVTGFTLDGKTVTPECIDEACIPIEEKELAIAGAAAAPDAGAPVEDAGGLAAADGGDAGAPAAADGGDAGAPARTVDAGAPPAGAPPSAIENPCAGDGPACFDTCPPDSDCPTHDIQVVADKASAEENTVAELQSGKKLGEQMWVNYYADTVTLDKDVKLLNDATGGWSPQHAAQLTSPKDPGTFRVWAVVHDVRGGVSWVRVRLGAR